MPSNVGPLAKPSALTGETLGFAAQGSAGVRHTSVVFAGGEQQCADPADGPTMGRHKRSPPWAGRIVLGPGWAGFSGDMGDNRMHTHHALQLVLAPRGTVTVSVHATHHISAPGLLISAEVPHRVWSGPAMLLYVDRESRTGHTLALAGGNGVRVLTEGQRDAALDAWPQSAGADLGPLLATLGLPSSVPNPTDRRSDRVRGILESLPDRVELNCTLEALAREAALPPSHFRHRVRALVGMPLRPYLRWLRLRRALMRAASGADLSRAAQDAGFADAAHLSRTMQRHFGVPPSAVLTALRTP
jgi:AraC-like DNA-binding protein